MTIMTIRIPENVKEALDKALAGEDKDAIIAQIIRDGLAAGAAQAPEADAVQRCREAVDAVLASRKQPPYFTDAEIRRARDEGRP